MAVIALLMGILLPAMLGARNSARGAVCLHQIGSLGMANHLFAHDHDTMLCPHNRWNRSMKSATGAMGVNQEWCFADPVRGPASDAMRNGTLGRYAGDTCDATQCPCYQTPDSVLATTKKVNLAYPQLVHYGYNGLLLGYKHPDFNTMDQKDPGYRTWIGYRIGSIRDPARTVMFADSAQRVAKMFIPQKDLYPPLDVWFDNGEIRSIATPSVHGRHTGNRASVSWVDGHAELTTITTYPNQNVQDLHNNLGFLAPPSASERDNAFMFVR